MPKYAFQLYVTGQTPRSEAAIRDLQRICDEALGGACEIEVIDVLARADLADSAGVLATPTLIKQAPAPSSRIVGDLSDARRVLATLGLADVDEIDDGGY